MSLFGGQSAAIRRPLSGNLLENRSPPVFDPAKCASVMRRGPFTETRFALCEGYEDSALIRGLIGTPSRHLNSFDVSPIPDLADAAGSGGFENAIIGSDAIRGFEKVTSVIIIADNDDDPAKSFAAVRAQLERAKNNGNLQHDWAVPNQAGIKTGCHTVRCHLDVAPRPANQVVWRQSCGHLFRKNMRERRLASTRR